MTENEMTRRVALGTVGTAMATLALGAAAANAANEGKPRKMNVADFKSKGIARKPPARATTYTILGQAGWYTEISRPAGGGVYDKDKPVPDNLVPAGTKEVYTTMSYVVGWDKNDQAVETPLAAAGIVSTIWFNPTTKKWLHWVRAQFSNKADDVNWVVGVNFHFLFLG